MKTQVWLAIGMILVGSVRPVASQESDSRRVQATRTELQALLTELDQLQNSPGYSKRLRDAKKAEATLVRRRLEEGDFQVGDQVALTVANEAELQAKVFTVRSGRTLVLPGLPEIPLSGVLRSELPGHLTEQLGKFIRNPRVDAKSSIRLTVLGGVGKPGFYYIPADAIATDIVTEAGGPGGASDLSKTVVRRDNKVIVTAESMQQAFAGGVTVDQLNIHGGDEVVVGTGGGSKFGFSDFASIARAVTASASLIFLASRIFKF